MAAPLAATVGEGGLGVPAGVGGRGAGEMTGDEVLKPAGSTTGTAFAGWGVGGGVGPGLGAALGWGLSAGVGEGVVAAATGDANEVVNDESGAVVSKRKGVRLVEGGVGGDR